MEETTADGMCFLHVLRMELGIDDMSFVWDIASALLLDMAGRLDSWKAYFHPHLDRLLRAC